MKHSLAWYKVATVLRKLAGHWWYINEITSNPEDTLEKVTILVNQIAYLHYIILNRLSKMRFAIKIIEIEIIETCCSS